MMPLTEEIGNCQNWKLSELEIVRIGVCQNWNLSELEFVRILTRAKYRAEHNYFFKASDDTSNPNKTEAFRAQNGIIANSDKFLF